MPVRHDGAAGVCSGYCGAAPYVTDEALPWVTSIFRKMRGAHYSVSQQRLHDFVLLAQPITSGTCVTARAVPQGGEIAQFGGTEEVLAAYDVYTSARTGQSGTSGVVNGFCRAVANWAYVSQPERQRVIAAACRVYDTARKLAGPVASLESGGRVFCLSMLPILLRQ